MACGQPGAFSRTTTVTGLPSTPGRNPTVQPQESRACVKPPRVRSAAFIRGSYYSALQQRLDVIFEEVLRLRALMAFADRAVLLHEHRDGNRPHRTEHAFDVRLTQPDQHGIVHLEIVGIRP